MGEKQEMWFLGNKFQRKWTMEVLKGPKLRMANGDIPCDGMLQGYLRTFENI